MTKEALRQYAKSKKELDKQRLKLKDLEKRNYHGEHSNTIERLNTLIKDMEEKTLPVQRKVYEFINSIPDSFMRRILLFRYIDGLPWNMIAYKIGEEYTEAGVKKAYSRFINANSDK